MELPDGLRIEIEFGEARVGRPRSPQEDGPLSIGPVKPGECLEGAVRIGGRGYRASWRVDRWEGKPAPSGVWGAALPLGALRFPLMIRGWRAGDRVRTAGGTKSLKKLFLERRVRRSARGQLPVLVDADGAVLWVGGVERAAGAEPRPGEDALFLTIAND